MPLFGAHTPEALLGRSDSKNPATTCKGLTSNGRPCRRAISAVGSSRSGVLAVASLDDDGSAAAAFYCWQHKDQAEDLVDEHATPSRKTRLVPLQERTSLDTLVDRLGVLELDEDPQRPASPGRRGRIPPSTKQSVHHAPRPPTWGSVQSPVIEVPLDLLQPELSAGRTRRQEHRHRPSQKPKPQKKSSMWTLMCCGSADDDYVEVVRHKNRTRPVQAPEMEHRAENRRHGNSSVPYPQATSGERRRARESREHRETELAPVSTPVRTSKNQGDRTPRRPSMQGPVAMESPSHPPRASLSNQREMVENPLRPPNARAQGSETTQLLSLIPTSLSPQTTSSLLTELSKPISSTDEPGYIYIFWLTPESQSAPPVDVAKSFMNSSSPGSRRPSYRAVNTLEDEPSAHDTDGRKTILLKIGRARNVHRRMTQWENQCGYTPSLLRFYPHISSTSPSPASTPDVTPKRPALNSDAMAYLRRMSETHAGASPPRLSPQGSGPKERRPSLSPRDSNNVRQVQNVKRVERLIHLELSGKRVKKDCDACGRVHMEWFEVEATREGVKYVDDVARRWIAWSESQAAE